METHQGRMCVVYQIKNYDRIDKDKWRKFVQENQKGNFFQTPELYETYTKVKNYSPLVLAVEDDDKIVALLLAVIIHEFQAPLRALTSRSIIQGGPLIENSISGLNGLEILLSEYEKMVKNTVLYTEIRNICDQSEHKEKYCGLGYKYIEHLNILVELNEGKDELFSHLSKSRRRAIRKAKKTGIIIEEINNQDDIPTFYNLLSKTYNNAKIPLADISLFYAAFSVLFPKNMIKFFLARYNDEYIGGIMTPIYNGIITEWYITGSKKHSRLYPSDAITWHPIEWGAENGYSAFDFGGAGEPGVEYGVRDFKLQFGGKLVNYGRFQKIHSPKKMWIANNGYELLKKCKR